MAAEYILAGGNFNVILCERGIRTFESSTRNTLDISAVPLINTLCHLPVVVDPSHGSGNSKLVPALSRAAIASGADGLLIEVHPQPQKAYWVRRTIPNSPGFSPAHGVVTGLGQSMRAQH